MCKACYKVHYQMYYQLVFRIMQDLIYMWRTVSKSICRVLSLTLENAKCYSFGSACPVRKFSAF